MELIWDVGHINDDCTITCIVRNKKTLEVVYEANKGKYGCCPCDEYKGCPFPDYKKQYPEAAKEFYKWW